MWQAALWGFVGGAALLLGALIGLLAAVGYVALGDASPATVAVVQAFAAGAILTMLADTMMPEAFEGTGATVGLVTCAGFVVAFLLGHAT